MPYFDQERKGWRGVVKKEGKRYTSLFPTKTEAKHWETAKRKELENPAQEKIQTGMDLLTACNKYLDYCKLRNSKKECNEKKALYGKILRRWGNLDVEDVTSLMVIEYLEDRANEVSNNAWNVDRKRLSAMFGWLSKVHVIKENPVQGIDHMPVERKTDYIPPAEDFHKVMMVASDQDIVMIKCYYYTFARRSELFDWTWDDIDFEKGAYRLWTRKRLRGDKEEDWFKIEKDSDLYEVLFWQWRQRNEKSPYVFTNPKSGKKYTTRRRFLKGLCKRAGVKPFGFKALRKLGPSILNDTYNVSKKKLQSLLRHKSQNTTEIYLKNVDNDLASVVRLLERKDTQKDTQRKRS